MTAIVLVGSAGIALLTPAGGALVPAGQVPPGGVAGAGRRGQRSDQDHQRLHQSAASALATPRELGMVNLLGWVSLAVGSGPGSSVRVGDWRVSSTASLSGGPSARPPRPYIAARHLRLSEPEPVGQPATAP